MRETLALREIYNAANQAKFQQAIEQHVRDPLDSLRTDGWDLPVRFLLVNANLRAQVSDFFCHADFIFQIDRSLRFI
jgi:hypothetical protein